MEIQEIKQRLSIDTVLKHYGLQASRNNMLKCPFHEEKEPSLKIYTYRQIPLTVLAVKPMAM